MTRPIVVIACCAILCAGLAPVRVTAQSAAPGAAEAPQAAPVQAPVTPMPPVATTAAVPAPAQPAQAAQAPAPAKSPEEAMREEILKYRERSHLERQEESKTAFERDFDAKFNVTPEEIGKVRSKEAELEHAAKFPDPAPAAGHNRTVTASLEPGAALKVVRAYPGQVTAIRVLDSSGASWPVSAHAIGDEKRFLVQKPNMEPFDTVIVTPLQESCSTNLTFFLDNSEGKSPVPPLSVQIVAGLEHSGSYDAVLTIRADRTGPRAKLRTDAGPNMFVDDTLVAVLDGVPPKGAVRAKSSDPEVEAWDIGGSRYVRSRMKVMWPAWVRRTSSGEREDGVNVYELPPVDEVMFEGGRTVRLGATAAREAALAAKGGAR
jgi:intracellular multiplication protein IcmK